MSDRSNQSAQEALSLQRQRMLDQSEASQKVVEELSNEELEMVAGGISVGGIGQVTSHALEDASEGIRPMDLHLPADPHLPEKERNIPTAVTTVISVAVSAGIISTAVTTSIHKNKH